jgi:hypothetical protein
MPGNEPLEPLESRKQTKFCRRTREFQLTEEKKHDRTNTTPCVPTIHHDSHISLTKHTTDQGAANAYSMPLEPASQII